ncbi:hypothetical protein ACFLRF_01340 [Candidatus Altiarchaeota archaeon]
MGEATKKFVFYGTLAALSVFWAEVVSTNVTWAAAHPAFYLAYGLLVVLFIDTLMRYQVREYWYWYLYGALVGLITETYVAKVTFYGAGGDTHRVLGIAPAPILFILLFYHAFLSFMVPAYTAKRILGMPLPIRTRKLYDLVFLATPFFLVIFNGMGLKADPLSLIPGVFISTGILIAWFLTLNKMGDIKDVLLSKKTYKRLLWFTIIAYIIFLLTTTNRKAHNHAPTDFPILPMIGVSLVIFGILYLIHKTVGKGRTPVTELSYSPKNIDWKLMAGWLAFYLVAGLASLPLIWILRSVAMFIWVPIWLAAVAVAAVSFPASLIALMTRLIREKD